MSVEGMIPADAQGLAIVVLLYTLGNAVAAGLVVLMHFRHGDPFGYVPLCACFMIVNIVAAFIQQIHFYTSFESIQTASYNYQVSGNYTGKPAFTGTNTPLDTTLYEIQLYCYNVESLLFLSWIAGLWRHVWRLRIELLDKGGHMVSTTVKVAAIIVPAILIGIANASSVDRTPGVSLILCNILLAGSVAIGLILLALVFYKYVSIQKYLSDSSSQNNGFFARFKWRIKFSLPSSAKTRSQRSRNMGSQMQSQMQSGMHSQMQSGVFNQSVNDATIEGGSQLPARKPASAPRKNDSMYDKWLLIRFCICFVLLCIMQIYLIYYSIARYLSSTANSKTAKLDLSSGSATISLVMFIPGVTLGLLIFIVFGTTGPFRRDYATWARFLVSGCGGRSTRNSLASGSLHRSESVVRLTNLDRKTSQRSGGEEAGLGKGGDGEYRVSVTPVVGEAGEYDDRQLGMGIMMTRSIKQSEGR
ncbi:hypothetical protein VTO58DRAFT_109402 [Aureobasidium pullulans]|nr:hypothetical protein D6C80_08072 [Aureobasidium pullulans]